VELNDHLDLFHAILSSPGMAHIYRTYARTFSLNIFQRNAQELLAATHSVRDSDYGLQLMAINNREAGQQAHREISRFVHNFAASAMTLVEHTRNFVREHYEDTAIKIAYDRRVEATFASEPVVQFVQNLRNYFVHKGLPDSEMFIDFQSTGDSSGAGTLETGVRYKTATFLEWDGWNAPAKHYIESAGEYIDIHAVADAYVEKVLAFHQWLDVALAQFHANDLAKLQEMQEKHAALSRVNAEVTANAPPESKVSDQSPTASPALNLAKFEFPTAIARAVDEAGSAILAKIRKLDFPTRQPNAFPSERQVATITADKLVETPILRGSDINGRPVIAFIISGSEVFGLDLDIFAQVQHVAEKVLEAGWAKISLNSTFIEQTAIKWLRSSFQKAQRESLSGAISGASRDEVRERDFWAPIACLEVEEKFAFGSAEIAPISRAMMDQLETKALTSSPKQRDDVAKMFADLRSKMQGLAGVLVHAKAERTRVLEEGMAIAQNAVGLLRFFSPVASAPWQVCSTALLGTEVLPRSQVLVLGEDDFLFSDGSVFQPFIWRLSKADVSDLFKRGLAKASVLVSPDGLNEFQLAVRASLLLYSTSTTVPYPGDRLVYALSALEGILLKHSMEPTEYSIEERMSLLLSNERSAREQIGRNVRDAYRFRKRHGVSVLSPHDQNSLNTFIRNTYFVLCTALENSNLFSTKNEFIDAVERRKAEGIVEAQSASKETVPPAL